MFDGLKTCEPRTRTTCFERRETAAVAAKIHQPRVLHQSPCCVPGTRRTKATPLPVTSALAGHISTPCRRQTIATSGTAQAPREIRICATESRNAKAICPSICSETIEVCEGLTEIAITTNPGGVAHWKAIKAQELFAEHVIPVVRSETEAAAS